MPFLSEGAIQKKAGQTSPRGLAAYASNEHARLTSKLGHYSQVQSINCEDTVTWAAFHKPIGAWFPSILQQCFGTNDRPQIWETRHWARARHRDTGLVTHGPEADVEACAPTIECPAWRYIVEAKWTQDIDGKQGSSGKLTQLDFRGEIACDGNLERGQYGVLVIAPAPKRYSPARRANSVFRRYFTIDGETYRPMPAADRVFAQAITWEAVAAALDQVDSHREIAAYLRWRLSLLPSVKLAG